MGKREDNKKRTEQRLLDAGIRLLGGPNGENVTVQDIADEAGVSRATFFNYFDSKQDIATAFGRRQRESIFAFAETLPEDMPTADKILAVLRADIDSVHHRLGNVTFARYIMMSVFGNERLARAELQNWDLLAQMYGDILTHGIDRGEVPSDLDIPLASRMIVEMYFSAQSEFLFGSTEVPCAELIERRARMLFTGFGIS
ncbi:TetR/AcrR family transcriptional regulator [Eggerthella sp. YY7918]|uniref:TetR/AcrR family transcriptional regulator n=1 Tax=Eggerthella sp. (strain YY7918) TaxID=502558 RepID=UPI0002171589|nr:TetR/AcrR family transcriptional regulator [Eggerthella sp. YY7918]BAK44955.1 transcriptional regulator [Eggerthella sp. YY7918]